MEEVDVVIIGSGYGGSINAARLTEAGFGVVVLERGPRWSSKDFKQSEDPRNLDGVVELFTSSQNIVYRTGRITGGASIPMDGAHFRAPLKSLEQTETGTGRRLWPALYTPESLAPYYDKAEAMLGVRQFGWDEIPRGGGMFAKMLDLVGASCDRGRLNYKDCLHCGFCSQGCIFDKKNSMILNYIPAAEAAGAEFRSDCWVDHVEPFDTGYKVRYRMGGAEQEIWGQRVIISAGGIHSPALLLRSAPYLSGLSAHVGEHFNINGEHSFVGILPEDFDDLQRYRCYKGMENAGLMSYHWFESDGFTLHPGSGLEPSLLVADIAMANHPVLPARAWGMEYKRFVETIYPSRAIAFAALGLADSFQAVVLSDDGVSPDIEARDRTNHDAYLDLVDERMAAVSEQTGVVLLPTVPRRLSGQTSAHLLAACRMAESVDDGVVDADCQVFGHENLYVCDASVIPYALGVNPALTVSAVAERTAQKLIEKG